MVRPSARRLLSLLSRVHSGNYSLFTRTEQDIIDAEFDPAAHCGLSTSRASNITLATAAENRPSVHGQPKGHPEGRVALVTPTQAPSSEADGCVGHAYLGQPLLHSIVLHHKIHAGIAEPRAGPKDKWWRDQVLRNLTCSLCSGGFGPMPGFGARDGGSPGPCAPGRIKHPDDKVTMGAVASRRVLLAATAIRSLWRYH